MDSISNSGVSLILNPDIANVINDNQHQHDLSTCEEEFENQEEIQQMLANAFDSQSLSNTDNDEHQFDDDEAEEEEQKQLPIPNLTVKHILQSKDNINLEQENEILRKRINEYVINDEIYQKNILKYEHNINELNEKYEEKLFLIRIEYEKKFDELTNQIDQQQIEILTLKQMYDTINNEKIQLNEQINHLRLNEENFQEKYDQLQIEYNQLLKLNKKSLMINNFTQTEINNETEQKIENLTNKNLQLTNELIHLSNQLKTLQENEQLYLKEKLSKQTIMISIKTQTDFIDNDDNKKSKQLQIELDDYKLKLNSKQIELNSLKFDYDNLKQDMNDRLSLLKTTISSEQINKILIERDQYLNELNKLKNELPELKQEIINNFQIKMITFKEQAQIITEYEEKLKTLQKQQLSDDERRIFEQKIEELTRANDKCSQYITKREQEHRQREKISLNPQQFDETKRKYNDEIHRLYDQIAKQNQQQILLIDEHQKQIERLKRTYDERYRILLDEWKQYNNDLHDNNIKLTTKLKEYEKLTVQLRYHITNLQIEYLQNGGNSNKIIQITNEIK